MANRRNKAQLGTKQLQESRRSTASPEDSTDATQPDSSGRPLGGEERGAPVEQKAEEAVCQELPSVEADEASGAAEGKWGEWPFRVVKTDEDLLALGEWLQALGNKVEKIPVGISAVGTQLAFATKTQGWLLRPRADGEEGEASNLWRNVLKKVLTTERVSPALVTRDTGSLVAGMGYWLEQNTQHLIPNIIHDMAALEYTTGRATAQGLSPLKDALDCAAVGPTLAMEAPKFYHKVAMPLVRHNAGSQNVGDIENKNRWTITYDYLLLRVLTYYTKDPTMILWFQDGKDPLGEFSNCLEIDSRTSEAIPFLLWLVCGEDDTLMARLYPNWMDSMPDAPKLIKALHIEKKLPNLQMGLMRLLEEYTTGRRAETLYNRRSPWGLRPEELLHFSIMGSVCDILDVLVASLLKHGSENHWLIEAKDKGYPHWLRAQVVGYNGREPMEWQRELEALSHLNNPLGQVPLDGKVSVE